MINKDETANPRSFLASRLTELWKAAGSPLLDSVAHRCLGAGRADKVTGKNISAWKTGVNVPHNFEDLDAVTHILIIEASRHASADNLTPGLLTQNYWHLWWKRARQSPTSFRDEDKALLRKRLGQPLAQITNPYNMEIHPTIQTSRDAEGSSRLTMYAVRSHDYKLRRVVSAAKTQSDVVALVGDSSTGKTRACWEAICTLPPTWHIWHPVSPSCPEALWEAISGNLIGPRTVLWLNELSRYLDTPEHQFGEKIAASLRDLLRSPEHSPVLVIGTLWRNQWDALTRYPSKDDTDRHAQARSLLRNHEIAVAEKFSEDDLSILRATCADDIRMIEAASRPDGKVTQFLAGAFELVRRYNLAPPSAYAAITAAIDIKRLGPQSVIAEDFLLAAAQGYIDDDAWDQLTDDWGISALEYATRPCLGVPGPLTKVRLRSGGGASEVPLYRLSDYLEQQGRKERRFFVPPETFWTACAEHASTINELHHLAYEAQTRARFRWAAAFYLQMAREGELSSLQFLADHRLLAGDEPAARMLFHEATDHGLTEAWADLAKLEEAKGNVKAAEELLRKAGEEAYVLEEQARLRVLGGDYGSAQILLEVAAAQGSISAKRALMLFLEANERDPRRAQELRNELGSGNVIDKLITASDALRRSEAEMIEAEEVIVTAASSNFETMSETFEILRTQRSADSEEDATDLIIMGRIEKNLGLLEAAEKSFKRALDGGSMHGNGSNRALQLLAEVIAESGSPEIVSRLLKYGLELDGTIAEPWLASITHPKRLPVFGI